MSCMVKDAIKITTFHSRYFKDYDTDYGLRVAIRVPDTLVRWYCDDVIWLYCQYQHVETDSKQTH